MSLKLAANAQQSLSYFNTFKKVLRSFTVLSYTAMVKVIWVKKDNGKEPRRLKCANVQCFLTNFFVEFLVEFDVTSNGCVALCCVGLHFVVCFILCCVVSL